jgi:hypothetical protein
LRLRRHHLDASDLARDDFDGKIRRRGANGCGYHRLARSKRLQRAIGADPDHGGRTARPLHTIVARIVRARVDARAKAESLSGEQARRPWGDVDASGGARHHRHFEALNDRLLARHHGNGGNGKRSGGTRANETGGIDRAFEWRAR